MRLTLPLLLGACLAAGLTSAQPVAAQDRSVGVVKNVLGDVFVERAAPLRLSVGDDLLERDVIVTNANSAFGATLADGATLSMGEKSRLQINAFSFEPSDGLFDLFLKVLSGRFVYASGRIGEQAPDKVRIETPYLTVGTRGTRFAVVVPEAAP